MGRVGLICLPGLEAAVTAGRDELQWVEIEPQVSWRPDRGVDSVLRSGPVTVARELGLPILVHSVSAPVGGTVAPPRAQVDLLAALVAELECPWISEHLSILRIPDGGDPAFTGVLLAPPQTDAAVDVAAANIGYLRCGVGVPVAFETGVNYLRPRAGELSDGSYFRAVAEAADCGILLDLHNLWCNEQNGRQPAREVIGELALERVWEIHVAAGYRRDGYYLDAHSGPTDQPVLDLLAAVVPTLPNLRVVVFEVSPDRVGPGMLTHDDIVEHLGALASIVGEPGFSPDRAARSGLDDVQRWEQSLGGLTLGHPVTGELAESLSADPGHRVWRDIALASRRGQLAGLLPLTVRLLLDSVGEAAVLERLGEIWACTPPAETSAAEIHALAPLLRAAWSSTVPLLDDVLDVELRATSV